MGFRFRKSIKILPGVRVNIGKSGISSVTVGPRGNSITAGKSGVRQNIGLPGTGLSWSRQLTRKQAPQAADAAPPHAYDPTDPREMEIAARAQLAPSHPALEYDHATGEWRPSSSPRAQSSTGVAAWFVALLVVIAGLGFYFR